MNFKYFFSFLILFIMLIVANLSSYAVSEVVFYKDESKICTPCSQGKSKIAYPTSDVTSTMNFAKNLDLSQKKSYCRLANKAVNELKNAFNVELNSEENLLFNLSSNDISRFFSLTIPNAYTNSARQIETSDFTYRFFSDNVCEAIGFCFAMIDLNKNSKPNVPHHDIIFVNFLYDGRTLKMEEFPASFYTSVMCGE